MAADACTAALAAEAGPGTGVATLRAVSQFFLMGFEGDVRESGLKPSSAAGRAVGQAPKPFPGPLAADACTAALAAEAGPGVATLRAVSQFFLMGFEGDVRESGLKPSSAAGRAVGQAPKPFPGPLAADACAAALAAEAGPGVATLRAVSQFFLMGFEGDVRESGLKPSSAAGRAVGQAPKPFPGPLAADACTAALAATMGATGVATLRAVSQFFLMGFEGDVRESGLKPSSAAGRAVGQAPKPFPGPLAADACTAALAAEAGPGVATMGAVSQSFLMGFEGDVRESGLKPSSAAGRAVGQAPKPFLGPLAADACTAALAAEAGPGVATLRAVSQFFLMGFEGDVRESGLKPSSAAGRAVGQAPKPFPGPGPLAADAADACTAALAAEAGPGVATLRAVSQFFLMGFEGDVRGSGLKPSSAAGRAVGQAPKPFPGPLAADACTAALAAEAGPGVATLRAVSQFFLMGFEGDVRESGLKPSSAAGRAVGQAPKPFPGPLAADACTGQAPKPFPGPLAADACTAALAAEAGPGTGVATLMGFEGDVREFKPSSAAGRAVGQAPKPFPGPLAADACTAALAAEAGPGVATLRP